MHNQPTIAELRAALEASYRSMTPQEHFQRMVRNGLIDSQGELTSFSVEMPTRNPAHGDRRQTPLNPTESIEPEYRCGAFCECRAEYSTVGCRATDSRENAGTRFLLCSKVPRP